MITPELEPATCSQVDMVGRFGVVIRMLRIRIPLHGLLALHSNFTASTVVDVPFMLLYRTLLTWTPDVCICSLQC